jgi:hypothetical protein
LKSVAVCDRIGAVGSVEGGHDGFSSLHLEMLYLGLLSCAPIWL